MTDKSADFLKHLDQLGIEGIEAALRDGKFGDVSDSSNWRSTMAMQWIKDNRESRALSLASASAASAAKQATWAKWAALIAMIAAISANAGLIQELISFLHGLI